MSPPTDVPKVAARLARPIPEAPKPKVRCVCTEDGPWCGNPEPGGVYGCSRPPNHKGDHVACGTEPHSHKLANWGQRKPRKVKGAPNVE